MGRIDRWNRALSPETRENLVLNATIRLLALLGLAALWLVTAPGLRSYSLLGGVLIGLLVGGLNLLLSRSVRFMRVWRERTLLRAVVGGGVAGCFVFAVERAFAATVVAAAVALALSVGYHAYLFGSVEEDF